MSWVDQFCHADIPWGAVAPPLPSCLDEMGDLSYQDNLALYALMREMTQHGQYHFDVTHAHTHLGIA